MEQIEHFTGSGLYDRDFIEVLRNLNDPTPFLRGIVAELGYKRKEIPYEQPKRRAYITRLSLLLVLIPITILYPSSHAFTYLGIISTGS